MNIGLEATDHCSLLKSETGGLHLVRKGIAWGPSNPLWRWQHRKVNKSPKRHMSTVRHMARRRISRARRYYSRRRRSAKSKAIPIIPVVTGIAPTLMGVQAVGGIEHVMDNPQETVRQVLYQNSGYDMNTGGLHWDILTRNIGMWIGGYAVHMIANRTVNKSIHKIPMVGKYISL